MWELTDQELRRQDFVDNAIFELIQRLLPTGVSIDWDMSLIGPVRDAITRELVVRGLVDEQQFYAYEEI